MELKKIKNKAMTMNNYKSAVLILENLIYKNPNRIDNFIGLGSK
jgi:hypothetical protein